MTSSQVPETIADPHPPEPPGSEPAAATSRSRAGRLLDNVGALFLRQVAVWLFSFVTVLFVPRYLGDEGLGQITFATGVLMMLVMLTGLGSDAYVVKEIAKHPDRASRLMWMAYLVRFAVSLLTFAALALVLQITPIDGDLRNVLYVTGLTVIVMSLREAQSRTIQGLERMRWLSLAETLHKGTVMGLGVGLLIAGYGVVVYAGAVLAGALVGLAVTTAFLLRLHRTVPRFSFSDLRVFLRGSLPFLLIGAVAQIYQWVDVTMLMAFTSNAVVGWYGAALQLFTTINVVPLILAVALLPALSRLRPESDELRSVARTGLSAVLLITVPMAVGLVMLSGRVIDFLGYPEAFSNTVPLLAILAVSLPLTGVLMVLAAIVASVDRQNAWARLMAAALLLNIVLNLIFIPLLHHSSGNGAIGAAATAIIVESLQLLFSLRLVPRGILNITLAKTLGKTVAASGAMAGVMLAAGSLADAGLLLLTASGGLTYAAVILLLRGVEPRDVRAGIDVWMARRAPDIASPEPEAHAS